MSMVHIGMKAWSPHHHNLRNTKAPNVKFLHSIIKKKHLKRCLKPTICSTWLFHFQKKESWRRNRNNLTCSLYYSVALHWSLSGRQLLGWVVKETRGHLGDTVSCVHQYLWYLPMINQGSIAQFWLFWTRHNTAQISTASTNYPATFHSAYYSSTWIMWLFWGITLPTFSIHCVDIQQNLLKYQLYFSARMFPPK